MYRLKIKPLSVNTCWQGRRYKTDEYKEYEKKVRIKLRKVKIDLPVKGDLAFFLKIGCSRAFDLDNAVKPFLDILQKKYKFNDNRITKIVLAKEIVKRGDEFIEFNLTSTN